MPTTPSAINIDAVIAELRKGWTRGSDGVTNAPDPTADVCLLGAVARVLRLNDPQEVYSLTPELPFADIIVEQFSDRLPSVRPRLDRWWTVTDFNDHPNTTLDDVILVCEKARAEQ